MSTGHPKQFVIYKDAKNEWRWTLYAENSRKIADSGEGYTTKANCLHGARLVASVAANAPIWNPTEQKWET